MASTFKNYLLEPKSKIGLVHGILTILGSFILSYLTMMVFSKFMVGDYAVRIMPSIILTPVVISFYGLWLLFSKNILACISKIVILVIVFIVLIEVL